MPKLLTEGGEEQKLGKQKAEMGVEGRVQKSEDRGQGPEGNRAKEEMREMLAIVRPVALRERMLKVWAKL